MLTIRRVGSYWAIVQGAKVHATFASLDQAMKTAPEAPVEFE